MALNHKPVKRVAGDGSADFASEFLKGCHKFLSQRMQELDIVTRPPAQLPDHKFRKLGDPFSQAFVSTAFSDCDLFPFGWKSGASWRLALGRGRRRRLVVIVSALLLRRHRFCSVILSHRFCLVILSHRFCLVILSEVCRSAKRFGIRSRRIPALHPTLSHRREFSRRLNPPTPLNPSGIPSPTGVQRTRTC